MRHADVALVLNIIAKYLPCIHLASMEEIPIERPLHERVDSKGFRYMFSEDAVHDAKHRIVLDKGTRDKSIKAMILDSKDRVVIFQWVSNSCNRNRVRRFDPAKRSNRLMCDRLPHFFEMVSGWNDELMFIDENRLFVCELKEANGDGYGVTYPVYRTESAIIHVVFQASASRYLIMEAGDVLISLPRSDAGFGKPTEVARFEEEMYCLVADPNGPQLYATNSTTKLVEIRLEPKLSISPIFDIERDLPTKLKTWHLSGIDVHRDQLLLMGVAEYGNLRSKSWQSKGKLDVDNEHGSMVLPKDLHFVVRLNL